MANPCARGRMLATALTLALATTAHLSAGNGFLQGWTLAPGADSHSVALGDIDGDVLEFRFVDGFVGDAANASFAV